MRVNERKPHNSTIRSLAVGLCAALGTAAGQVPMSGALDRTLPPIISSNQPPVEVAHQILLQAKVGGGIVSLGDDVSVAEMAVPGGVTISEALAQVLGPLNKYRWREVNGVVNIIPRGGMPPLLDTIIPSFEWRSGEGVFSVVGRLESHPEFLSRMSQLGYVDGLHHGPGLQKPPRVGGPPAPPQTGQVFVRRNIALIDLLNDIVAGYSPPAIWRYDEYAHDRTRAVTLTAR